VLDYLAGDAPEIWHCCLFMLGVTVGCRLLAYRLLRMQTNGCTAGLVLSPVM
jgi:hypothetical protein